MNAATDSHANIEKLGKLQVRTLIVQSNTALGAVWANHFERAGMAVIAVATGADALDFIGRLHFDVIVVDLVLEEGSALTIADFAQFSQPAANLIFVTDTTFFSDGSIFSHAANARAMLEKTTPPCDLAEIVQHYAKDACRAHVAHQSLR